MAKKLTIEVEESRLSLNFSGELLLYDITTFEKIIAPHKRSNAEDISINLEGVSSCDTAAALFIDRVCCELFSGATLICSSEKILKTIALVQREKEKKSLFVKEKKSSALERLGESAYEYYLGFFSFMSFLGKLFFTKISYLKFGKHIRYKEIAFEIHESAIKALGIIALTSFLIGVVVAYQSAYQLKIYGANIFIVDMLGISILRELAPLITAIVIAGRSGSAFTAQIGAMKITQEIDAMRTMGFDPYVYLVMPRILALMLMMPLLIFVADIMGIFGGMLIANIDLDITLELFLDRFNEVVAAKHFFIGVLKGPFFAFLIATIAIYRGLMVKDDTQSIGFNTTKSVVESIFAVIVCDALFSIAFTNLGI